MATGNTNPSKRITLRRYGPATITKVAAGHRVVADCGASADFRLDRGDITIDACTNCDHGYIRADLAFAWISKNCPVPPDAPMSVTIPLSRRGQLEADAAMIAEMDRDNAARIRRVFSGRSNF